jgi:hypothetical protein
MSDKWEDKGVHEEIPILSHLGQVVTGQGQTSEVAAVEGQEVDGAEERPHK